MELEGDFLCFYSQAISFCFLVTWASSWPKQIKKDPNDLNLKFIFTKKVLFTGFPSTTPEGDLFRSPIISVAQIWATWNNWATSSNHLKSVALSTWEVLLSRRPLVKLTGLSRENQPRAAYIGSTALHLRDELMNCHPHFQLYEEWGSDMDFQSRNFHFHVTPSPQHTQHKSLKLEISRSGNFYFCIRPGGTSVFPSSGFPTFYSYGFLTF